MSTEIITNTPITKELKAAAKLAIKQEKLIARELAAAEKEAKNAAKQEKLAAKEAKMAEKKAKEDAKQEDYMFAGFRLLLNSALQVEKESKKLMKERTKAAKNDDINEHNTAFVGITIEV